MAAQTKPPKAVDAKPSLKPVAKDDLQKLPMAEVEKRLGSSPDGLTDEEAGKRLDQYGPNEIAGNSQAVGYGIRASPTWVGVAAKVWRMLRVCFLAVETTDLSWAKI